jgi:hypothetical protein
LTASLLLAGCCGEGTETVACWFHTPIRDANGHLVHRSGTHYWSAEP